MFGIISNTLTPADTVLSSCAHLLRPCAALLCPVSPAGFTLPFAMKAIIERVNPPEAKHPPTIKEVRGVSPERHTLETEHTMTAGS